MNSAKVMFAQWNGQRLVFYSDEGISVITKLESGEWLAKTVWKKEDFDETTLKKLEVINKYVK